MNIPSPPVTTAGISIADHYWQLHQFPELLLSAHRKEKESLDLSYIPPRDTLVSFVNSPMTQIIFNFNLAEWLTDHQSGC